jgi:hypothetical protein
MQKNSHRERGYQISKCLLDERDGATCRQVFLRLILPGWIVSRYTKVGSPASSASACLNISTFDGMTTDSFVQFMQM